MGWIMFRKALLVLCLCSSATGIVLLVFWFEAQNQIAGVGSMDWMLKAGCLLISGAAITGAHLAAPAIPTFLNRLTALIR